MITPSPLAGELLIPSSKSHTIRALFIAALVDGTGGESIIRNPLDSDDATSARHAIEAFGAKVKTEPGLWRITGFGNSPAVPQSPVDVGNSGTTARFLISLATFAGAPVTIIGDESTSSRPMSPLLDALEALGVTCKSDNGHLPVTICGPAKGGSAPVEGTTSQYLSSLLLHAPLFEENTTLLPTGLNEKPYVEMTLSWLDRFGIRYSRDGYDRFDVEGNQKYKPFDITVPGDFSSATFFACMGAIPGNKISLLGLDMRDSQGDKAIFGYLEKMGAKVDYTEERITVTGAELNGIDIDLNQTPDALPAMAALAAHAKGKTRLLNVPQARIKETDRIAVMAEELGKLGIVTQELPDGLVITGGQVTGTEVSGHHDHRIVMALTLCATKGTGTTTIDGAEAVAVTMPTFADLFQTL